MIGSSRVPDLGTSLAISIPQNRGGGAQEAQRYAIESLITLAFSLRANS